MKKLISFVLAFILLVGAISFSVFADSTSEYTMQFSVKGINGSAEVYIDDVYSGETPYTAKLAKGTKITLVSNDDSFVCFADSNMNTLSEEKTYSFTFSVACTVYSFASNTNKDKAFVVYRNINDTKQILSYSTYSDISKMSSHFAENATLFGKTFVAWDKTVDEIRSLADNGETTITVNPVYTTTTETCTISATNGTVNGDSSATVIVGSQITLVSDTPELDDTFAYWTNANGDIISDKSTFTMFALYDETYRAVYVKKGEEPELTPSTSLKCFYLEDVDRIEIFTQRFITEGITVKANGLLYAKDAELEESAMTLENVDGTTLSRLDHTAATVSGFMRNTASCEEYICLRPFITYEDGGETVTVYGSRVIAKKNPGQTVWVDEGFETIASITTSALNGNNNMSASAAAGFSVVTSNGSSVASSASTGGYIIFDDTDLALAKSESVTVSADIMLTAYPTETISLITFITSGSGYNFFLKVNSLGELIGSDWGKIKDKNNNNLTVELNKGYNVKVVYNVATQIYDLYLDETLVSSKTFSSDIREATSLSIRFFEYNKGAVGTLDNLKIIGSSEEAERIALNTLSSWSSAYFAVTTDKSPVSYSTDEEMTFTFDLRNGTGGATCEKIKLEVKSDDDPTFETVTLDGGTGIATYTTSLEEAGFVYIKATACDASGVAYSGSEVAKVGAGADVTEIAVSETRPSDFDEFWSANVEDLMDIDPEIVEMELIAQTSNYKAYNVKIKAVDDSSVYSDGETHDYVSGVLTVPTNATELKIRLLLGGYGIYGANVDYNAGEIVFIPLAHSIEAYESSDYYTAYSNGDLKNYGGLYTIGANADRDEVYFKNMVLRDLQALRFVTDYFGSDGEDLWDGETVIVEGGSQGGFRGAAITSLADQIGVTVTKAELQMVWLCDINAEANGRIYGNFWPEFTYSAMQYYDSVFFGQNIDCEVEMRTGLGDDITPPTGVAALYNAIASSNKKITFIQNREHGSSGVSTESFTITSTGE